MIALRRKLERCLRHPVLGPFVLLMLALVAATAMLHAAHGEQGVAAEASALCFAFFLLVGPLVLHRGLPRTAMRAASQHMRRGPPPVPPGAATAPRPVRGQRFAPLLR